MIRRVVISSAAKKQLRKVPMHVAKKLMAWVEMVRTKGLQGTKKVPGFHDEPLLGRRKGQRSIRLSRSYRAIYVIENGQIAIAVVKEVSKHDY